MPDMMDMMDEHRLSALPVQPQPQQTGELRQYFPHLSERDLAQIVAAPPADALLVLQRCFGGDVAEAKAAWNDYVLRYIDGPHNGRIPLPGPVDSSKTLF